MIRLLYFSQAVPTTTSTDIMEIIASAQSNNSQKGITGMLVSGGKIFMQILEGSEQSVLSLYLNILQDKRHTEVEIMRVNPIIARLFENWSMQFFNTTPLQFEQILQFKLKYFAHEEPEEFMAALRGLKNMLQG
jgi:Sensors of blue-light using FAD